MATKDSSKQPVFIAGITKSAQARELKISDEEPRVIFAGRSNVGKSSLLNALTSSRIARVSQEPGRTREINFFRWHGLILVDLPGYGFAKVSKSLREHWGQEIPKFILSEPSLYWVVSLVDGRHGFTALDEELVIFLQAQNVPHLVAFTKMDKFKSSNQRRSAESKLLAETKRLGVQNYLYTSSQQAGGVSALKVFLLQGIKR